MEKVKYRCMGCGWTKELPKDWGDVRPRYCPTPTCEMSVKRSKGRKSFRTNPDMLQVTFVTPPVAEKKEVVQKTVEYEPKEQSSGNQRRHQQQSQRQRPAERAADESGTVEPKADGPKEG